MIEDITARRVDEGTWLVSGTRVTSFLDRVRDFWDGFWNGSTVSGRFWKDCPTMIRDNIVSAVDGEALVRFPLPEEYRTPELDE